MVLSAIVVSRGPRSCARIFQMLSMEVSCHDFRVVTYHGVPDIYNCLHLKIWSTSAQVLETMQVAPHHSNNTKLESEINNES